MTISGIVAGREFRGKFCPGSDPRILYGFSLGSSICVDFLACSNLQRRSPNIRELQDRVGASHLRARDDVRFGNAVSKHFLNLSLPGEPFGIGFQPYAEYLANTGKERARVHNLLFYSLPYPFPSLSLGGRNVNVTFHTFDNVTFLVAVIVTVFVTLIVTVLAVEVVERGRALPCLRSGGCTLTLLGLSLPRF